MATLTKITGLPELTTPRDEDLIQVIDDPSGTPANKYMTLNRVSNVANVLNYGADKTGLTDSTAAIQAAIDAVGTATAIDASAPAYTWITELEGGTVYFPRGIYRIDSKLTLPDRVSLIGETYSGCMIVAGSSYTDTSMIDAGGTSAIFDSRIRHLRIHANNKASIVKVINIDSWQEQCGLDYVSIDGFQSTAVGVYVADTSAGAAGWGINHCNFGGFSGNKAAIEVAATVPNAFQMQINQTTINSSGVATSGILFGNGRLHAQDLHIESATHGINMLDGTGLLMNITGSGSVVNLVTLDAGYASRMRAFMLDANGASGNTWNDLTATNLDYTGFKAFVGFGAD